MIELVCEDIPAPYIRFKVAPIVSRVTTGVSNMHTSAAIGIKSQPSRFAALMKDSDSDEETEVIKKDTAKSAAARGDAKATSKSKKNETALKNAKKRARRKKNQSKASHDQQEVRNAINWTCSSVLFYIAHRCSRRYGMARNI